MRYIVSVVFLFATVTLFAQEERYQKRDWSKVKHVVERELPSGWGKLVPGAQFMDRFLPMPKGKLSDNVWGGKNVLPRYIDNGIESQETSFWGGNILKGDDGKFHLFVCGWLESEPRGHRHWGRSIVYHSVCDNSIGPFVVKDTLGYGHNPDTYRLDDGSYVTYVFSLSTGTRTYGYYIAPTVNGPWTYHPFKFEGRDRKINATTNFTFSKRADGSFIGVAKDGKMWISCDGLSPYKLISQQGVYPKVEGYLEDPAIWKDNVQYNMVLNDAHGRVAYYMRSKNGIDWIWEEGIAYKPGFTRHENGYVENWHKYERIKIFQDEYGRAIQANFAVMDATKDDDKGSDNHSSKNVSIPMNRGMLLEWEGDEHNFPASGFEPVIRIKAEKGFNPTKDLDISSLRFGDAKEVNFGHGSRVIKREKVDKDLILTFEEKNHNIGEEEFAPKLLGKDKKGEMVFGYTRLPWVEYELPILSARAPKGILTNNGAQLSIEVENLGIVASQKTQLIIKMGNEEIGQSNVPEIEPYGKVKVRANVSLTKGEHELVIEIKERRFNTSSFKTVLGLF